MLDAEVLEETALKWCQNPAGYINALRDVITAVLGEDTDAALIMLDEVAYTILACESLRPNLYWHGDRLADARTALSAGGNVPAIALLEAIRSDLSPEAKPVDRLPWGITVQGSRTLCREGYQAQEFPATIENKAWAAAIALLRAEGKPVNFVDLFPGVARESNDTKAMRTNFRNIKREATSPLEALGVRVLNVPGKPSHWKAVDAP